MVDRLCDADVVLLLDSAGVKQALDDIWDAATRGNDTSGGGMSRQSFLLLHYNLHGVLREDMELSTLRRQADNDWRRDSDGMDTLSRHQFNALLLTLASQWVDSSQPKQYAVFLALLREALLLPDVEPVTLRVAVLPDALLNTPADAAAVGDGGAARAGDTTQSDATVPSGGGGEEAAVGAPSASQPTVGVPPDDSPHDARLSTADGDATGGVAAAAGGDGAADAATATAVSDARRGESPTIGAGAEAVTSVHVHPASAAHAAVNKRSDDAGGGGHNDSSGDHDGGSRVSSASKSMGRPETRGGWSRTAVVEVLSPASGVSGHDDAFAREGVTTSQVAVVGDSRTVPPLPLDDQATARLADVSAGHVPASPPVAVVGHGLQRDAAAVTLGPPSAAAPAGAPPPPCGGEPAARRTTMVFSHPSGMTAPLPAEYATGFARGLPLKPRPRASSTPSVPPAAAGGARGGRGVQSLPRHVSAGPSDATAPPESADTDGGWTQRTGTARSRGGGGAVVVGSGGASPPGTATRGGLLPTAHGGGAGASVGHDTDSDVPAPRASVRGRGPPSLADTLQSLPEGGEVAKGGAGGRLVSLHPRSQLWEGGITEPPYRKASMGKKVGTGRPQKS